MLAGLVLAAGLGVCALAGPVLGSDSGGLQTVGHDSVVVESGDTLWSIAASVAGAGRDVRAVVDEIQQVNGLVSSDLVPGQVLRLP